MVRHLYFNSLAGHSFNRQGRASTSVDSRFNAQGAAWDFKVENGIASDRANSRAIDKDLV